MAGHLKKLQLTNSMPTLISLGWVNKRGLDFHQTSTSQQGKVNQNLAKNIIVMIMLMLTRGNVEYPNNTNKINMEKNS